MALATASGTPAPAQMAPTAGIAAGSLSVTPEQGNRTGGAGIASMGVAQRPDTPPAPPILFSDVDPVLFLRLYPTAKDAKAEAKAAGDTAFKAAATVVASQQDQGDAKPANHAKPAEPPKH